MLKKDHVLRIAMPDWESTVESVRGTGDHGNLLNWMYGGRDYDGNKHHRQSRFAGLKTLLIGEGSSTSCDTTGERRTTPTSKILGRPTRYISITRTAC